MRGVTMQRIRTLAPHSFSIAYNDFATAVPPRNLALDISKSRDTLLDAFVGRFTRSF